MDEVNYPLAASTPPPKYIHTFPQTFLKPRCDLEFLIQLQIPEPCLRQTFLHQISHRAGLKILTEHLSCYKLAQNAGSFTDTS